MQATWDRIDRWLAANAPLILADLQAGATDAEIRETEAFLHITFPADVKASYRIHNGQTAGSHLLIALSEMLSLASIRSLWTTWKELFDKGAFKEAAGKPSGPIKAEWWNPQWIPITYDGSGNHLCTDLDPAPGGTTGQIITVWHDDAKRKIVAPSFRAWLEDFATQLEADTYSYSEEYGGLIERDQR